MSRLLLFVLLASAACGRATAAARPTDCPRDPTVAAEPPAPADPGARLRRLRGLAALDAGRFELARDEFAAALAAAPDDLAARALLDAATRALQTARDQAAESFASATPTVVPAPPWRHTLVREVAVAATTPAPRLVQISATRNHGTDEAGWFRRHNLRWPEYEVPNPMRGLPGNVPPTIAPSFGTHLLVQAIGHPDHTILIYGPNYSGGRLVVVLDASGRRLAFLDFDAYHTAPDASSGEQHVIWAELDDGVLYISHHGARGSEAMTAYITAVDLPTGALRWRSDPGVASAANFAIHGGHILSGHGSDAGPAAVIVLDRRTGLTVGRAPLASAPEYLFVRGGKLLVRGLDTDHEFELRQNRP